MISTKGLYTNKKIILKRKKDGFLTKRSYEKLRDSVSRTIDLLNSNNEIDKLIGKRNLADFMKFARDFNKHPNQ